MNQTPPPPRAPQRPPMRRPVPPQNMPPRPTQGTPQRPPMQQQRRPAPAPSRPPQKPPKKSSFGGDNALFLAILGVLLCVFVFLSIIAISAIPRDESDPADSTTPPADAESTTDPNHVPVTYPSSPTRTDYTLKGNGTTIDSSTIMAQSAILVSLKDFSVTASLDADAKIYPASMTKIMTLIVACENIKDASVLLPISGKILEYCRSEDATQLAMDPEDAFTATDHLYAVGIISAADSCLTLAEHIAGSEEAFVAMMNEKARALGLTTTHFANCTGLDHDDNYSTVREMATILAYALENEFCYKILSTDQLTVLGHYLKNGEETTFNRHLYNSIWSRLRGAGYAEKIPASLSSGETLLGGKTGFTNKGKYCLASFSKDSSGNIYIIVTSAGATAGSSVTDINAILTHHLP